MGASAAGGINQMGENVGQAVNTFIWVAVALCALGGVGAIGYAGKLLLKKSGDRGEDVEWSKIGIAVLGGAFLLSVTLIATLTVETLGGSSSDIGRNVGTIRR